MGLTPEQQEGQRIATRGMNKTASSRDEQIVSGRTEHQRRERRPVTCIVCGGERDPRKHPVCDMCHRGANAA